jgi:predicted secreted hydrolase
MVRCPEIPDYADTGGVMKGGRWAMGDGRWGGPSRFGVPGSGFGVTIYPVLFVLLIFLLFPGMARGDWKQADGPRQWSFPKDHGSHPEYRTEWWYFTGNLADSSGKKYGYQVTFFRYGLTARPSDPKNPWSVRDIYLAHFAITDASNNTFHYTDRLSRKGPGLAGADEQKMNVNLLGWSAVMEKNTIRLKASFEGMELKIDLVPAKPAVLHGRQGLSRKGPLPGQASYYYSFTDLKTTGHLKRPGMKDPVAVTGTSWFDQEFGSNQLSGGQAGWDWFALHLSDGRDLMIYKLRKKDGSVEKESSGTLVERDGTSRQISLTDIEMDILGYWRSPKTKGKYPAGWRIRLPSAHIDVTVKPVITDQELANTVSAGITYWEGAVEGTGTSKGKEVKAQGYVELTGYAGTIGGTF